MGELRVNKRFAALLTGITLVLLTFQNCGKSGFQTVDEADLLSSSLNGTNPGGKATAPIAYEVGLDSISYNSCVPNVKGAPTYFTLKATAGGTRGGVRLSPDFLAAAGGSLRPILGNAQVLDVQYKELIENTSAGLETQVALRSVTDFKASYTGTSPGGIWGSFDYLADDSWMTPVVESGRRAGNAFVGYSNRAPSNKSRLDFRFNQDFPASDYWSSLLGTQSFRACTAQGCQGFGQFHIAVGFSEEGNRSVIRSPIAYSSAQTKAVGRGYQLQFGYPSDAPGAGMRVLKGINEYNLASGTPVVEGNSATQWRCTEIPIMSSRQRGPAMAPQPAAAGCNPMSGTFAAQYYSVMNIEKIREILPPSQWELGFQNTPAGSRLCVVPTGMDCYPNEAFPNYQTDGSQRPFPYYVQYDPTQTCINEDNMATELTRTNAGAINAVCAHYITVCTKQ